MRDVSQGIRYVFQTRNQYSLAITGSATCAMEAAICNLLESGDTLMVLVHGLWGQRAGIMGRKHGYNVVEVKVKEFGDVFSLDEIESELSRLIRLTIDHAHLSQGLFGRTDPVSSMYVTEIQVSAHFSPCPVSERCAIRTSVYY